MRILTRLAILAFVFSFTSCGPPAEVVEEVVMTDTTEVESIVTSTDTTGVQQPSCTAADPDEYGNVVNWCDDGSNWWIDSDTGERFDMDASGNITTTNPIDVKATSP